MKTSRAPAWIILIVLAAALGHSSAAAFGNGCRVQTGAGEVSSADVLKQIYVEVKELGPYPGENFIKHEFFLGPADDDSYKREHIVVLIQVVEGVERMKIQITEMKNRPDNPRIQVAGKVRTISCKITARGVLSLLRSDYSGREIARLAPDVLRAVREKARLLKDFGAITPKSP
ncbi:MAG: hypothetical protein A2W03_01305 [Candidatus Aminicenantes bacterium RBG_16_63_16]|nr:MAG: hypothetical protein A2W03_01305 [Candidatus Aminicenantes bacterium RBG_16_63_16]